MRCMQMYHGDDDGMPMREYAYSGMDAALQCRAWDTRRIQRLCPGGCANRKTVALCEMWPVLLASVPIRGGDPRDISQIQGKQAWAP